jgi:hypothetical protein
MQGLSILYFDFGLQVVEQYRSVDHKVASLLPGHKQEEHKKEQ